MNEANFALAAEIIPETYIKIASQARKQRENIIKNLLSHVRTKYTVIITSDTSKPNQKYFFVSDQLDTQVNDINYILEGSSRRWYRR